MDWFKVDAIQRIGWNRWRADGIRVDDLPRIHNVADSPRNQKFMEALGLQRRTIPRQNHLHVDVQRHHMARSAKRTSMS